MTIDLTADEEAQINRELAEEQSEYIKDQLLEIVRKGISLMGLAKPQERLRAYEAQTYEFDAITLLFTDYLEQREAGTAEPLLAEAMTQQFEQEMMARSQGQDLSQVEPLEKPLTFWAECFKLPHATEIAGEFLRDWKDLRRQQIKREEER